NIFLAAASRDLGLLVKKPAGSTRKSARRMRVRTMRGWALRSGIGTFIGAAILGSLVASQSGDANADEAPRRGAQTNPPDDESFGLNKVWVIDITIPSDEYQAMQPPPVAFPGAPPPPQAAKPRKPWESERNFFGMEFPWVRGELNVRGTTYQNVAIR